MSQLRWHPMLEEWVSVAAHRQVRPIALKGQKKAPACPFCPGGAEGLHAPYEFVAFENRFPSFTPRPRQERPESEGKLLKTAPGYGVCEVVLYSDRHDTTLSEASRGHIYKLVKVWTDRYRDLGSLPYVKYVFIFENKGAIIGVTLSHPHGQIYAFPYIPPKVERELRAEKKFQRRHRRCMLCSMLADEVRGKGRLVAANRSFVAIVPHFARYPYEINVLSRRHLGHLGEMSDTEHWHLAGILKSIMKKYDNLFGFSFPYIMLMHQTPTDGKPHRYHHFHIEFYPPHRSADKIKYLAGCESGAGTFINDTVPEDKAAELRRTRPDGFRD